MTPKKDDWEKPRSSGVHLTDAEIHQLRVAFNTGRKPRDIARELKCSTRIASKYFGMFRGGRTKNWTQQKTVEKKDPTPRARFYKSDFEV